MRGYDLILCASVEGGVLVHLALDCVGTKHSGGATVLLDLLRTMVNHSGVEKITIFASPRIVRRFDIPRSPKVTVEEYDTAEHHLWYRMWWYEWGLKRRVKQLRADVLFCFNGAGRGPNGTPCITFVQQALPLSCEGMGFLSWSARTKMSIIGMIARRSCTLASKVIVQTPTMRELVVRHYGVPTSKVLAVTPEPSQLPRQGGSASAVSSMRLVPKGQRLLYVGNTERYKNLNTVLKGMSSVRAILPGATLFGTWPVDSTLTGTQGVIGVGFLDGASLSQAYELADLLVMPSVVETVGLPLLEAMDNGVPVLAADRSYARDICADAGLFFDPADPSDFARQAVKVLTDGHLRQSLVEKGKERVRELRSSTPYVQMTALAVQLAQAPPT